MHRDKVSYGTRRLLAIHPIDICINLMGAGVTFIWFSNMQPGLAGGGDPITLRDRAIFVVVLIIIVSVIRLPVELKWSWPLIRQFRKLGASLDDKNIESAKADELSNLAEKLLNTPIKLSVINLSVWLMSGLIFVIVPDVFPEYCPWDKTSGIKIAAWTVFLGAPIVVALAYFVSESWIRTTVEELFPYESLLSRPHSTRINVLPRLLVVSLMIGVIPPVVISHVTLHQITDIRSGHQSIDNFLAQMPLAIFFLLGLSVVLAVILSLFLARSVSIPLRKTTLGMRRIGRGHLEARVKVVSCDEIGAMGEGFNVMAEGLRERDYIRQTFGSYLSDDVVTEILESPDGVKLGGELRNISILVSDLRGFTPLAESLEPSKVIEILNRYFERMTDVILRHNGTIDEFTGDGILVFFGAPKPLIDHEMVSVVCALEMRKALKEMNRENSLLNLPELRMGIGINAGQVIVGNLGSEKRKKYGAVGSPINIAFRVESLTGKDEILVTPSVYGQRLEQLELGAVTEATLKGFEMPIALRSVMAIK